MSEAAKPVPYLPDVLAKGWRFELDVDRLEQSDTWALATPDVRPWLLMLWVVSWKQKPCGSLPADDALIVARLGIAPKVFSRVKAVLMRGWWKAEDGRLYHDTIAACVLDMLGKKTAETQRKKDYRERKLAEARLAEANSAIAAQQLVERGFDGGFYGESVPTLSHGTDAGQTRDSTGIDATRTRTRTGLDSSKPRSVAGEGANFDDAALHGTDAGRACKAMREAGIADANPGHPMLAALLQAGVTPAELVSAARVAVKANTGFAYALTVAANARTRAADAGRRVSTAGRVASSATAHSGFSELDYHAGVNPDGSF